MPEKTYPRHVHQRGGVYRICPDAETYAEALADGWVDHPLLEWGRPETYQEWDGTPLEDEEPAPVVLARKRGRPRKQETIS